MNHAVDLWKTWQENEEESNNYTPTIGENYNEEESNDYSTTIGEDYEVLLRCSQRLKGKSQVLKSWEKKANILKNSLTEPAELIFVLGNSNNWKLLWNQLRRMDAIAVKIPAVFPQKEPGTLLYQASVPLALWLRQQLPEIEHESIFAELLRD